MKRVLSSWITWLFAALLVALGGMTAYQYTPISVPQLEEVAPPVMTPEAQTERITSHLLKRKIEELRSRAVYLQHREEGLRLMQMGLGIEEEPEEEEEIEAEE